MKFITPIYLINYKVNVDDDGDKVKSPTERKVLCNKLSIGQNEFYESHSKGFKPELKFEVRVFEYKDEDTLKFNNILYNIIRTFNNYKNGTVELTCSRPIMR